ncbi:MAG: response regulator [Hydrogenophaga sp.]|uniref:sensor histidine kinase n=1 Tax=Hydrogenophaga sp. TaxID=1904254 RepID=UPI00262D0CE3|nr:hybrid sensor histidine kinase/response regulator [Hydrogenophaga sp.]MDM7944214.1 response regulator [Hydrogenophaga sp.]
MTQQPTARNEHLGQAPPLSPGRRFAAPPQPRAKPTGPTQGKSVAHILVVEDQAIVAFNLQQQLMSMGYHVPDIAASGSEALALVTQARPDLILMDIHIEGSMDGIGVAARIHETCPVPVIYLTAYSQDATLERARQTHPYGYLIKPFSERELHATIQMALERHSVEQALAESQRLLQQALDSAHMGTVEFDCDTGHLRLSHQSALLMGQRQDRALSFAEFLSSVHEADRPALALRMNDCNEPLHPFNEEFRVRHEGPVDRWVKIEATPLAGHRFSGIVQNISGRKLAEIQMSARNDELEHQVNARTGELQQTMRELEAFTYSAAHDLRAPIRAIAGLSTAMIEDYAVGLGTQGTRLLQTMGSSAVRMGDLVDALLEMSRLSRSSMNLTEVDISELARDIGETLLAAEPQRRAVVTVAPGLRALADPPLVRCVLDNLMRNAWKFSEKKDATAIDVGSFMNEEGQVFFVRDEGCGFDMAFAERLFAPFNRLHHHTEFSGSGIGLSIVKRIVSRHGGRVWATSVPGEGSTFFFTLQE